MIDTKALWIGDKLKLLIEDEVGTFEGLDISGKIKVKVKGKIILSDISNLEIYKEDDAMPMIIFDDVITDNKITKRSSTFPREIDLHIEKLNPQYKNKPGEAVVDYQIKCCQDYIQEAIALKIYKVTIIHGKGEGKLKSYIHELLKSYTEVKMKILTNQDGATEVWLSY
jgi:dsDNA-specific endonuclease/ATPase MutS2